jgi:saccharopine dehydrogenase (NAD+, L-lysine forming)
MSKVKIGILREGKVPPDFRVPMTPKQCAVVKEKFQNVEVVVQTSSIRCFTDEEYRNEGIIVQDSLNDCDILFGVKEVQIEDLIPNKKFVFFSHTIKKQPYNRALLKAILDKKIQLIDYEVIKNRIGKRLIGFGRYAGIVGAYNGFRAFGLKHKLYDLKPAHLCENRVELEQEVKKIILPQNTKITLTGFGRVGYGAREIMDLLPIIEVTPEEFINKEFNEPVYTHLEVEDYFARKDGIEFDKKHFYSNPQEYKSVFGKFANKSDMYIACHFWANTSPFILTQEDLSSNKRLKVIADVSCDVNGPIASTIRSTSISAPFYGYDIETKSETDYSNENAIIVMAVDNLPCELPKDASEDFGNDLIQYVLPPLLMEDPDDIIGRASETNLNGELTENFKYLEDYVKDLASTNFSN